MTSAIEWLRTSVLETVLSVVSFAVAAALFAVFA